jgi:hypothetical protein
MKEMKQWHCKNKHILGFIRWNGNDLPQLMLLRQAMDMSSEHPSEVDLLGPVDGRLPVRCSICDDVRLWGISIDSLLSLFSQLSDKDVFEFSQRLAEFSSKVVDIEDPAVVGPEVQRFGGADVQRFKSAKDGG